MADESSYFDVRDTFPPDCDLEDPTVKATASRINLMVFLLGDRKERDIFTMSLRTLSLQLIPRADEAQAIGLITEKQRDELVNAGEQLAAALKDTNLTLQDIYVTRRDELPEGIWAPGKRLNLPYADQSDEQKPQAKKVFEDGFLSDHKASTMPGIGDLTARDLYTMPAKPNREVHEIIQQAKGAGILASKPNGKACKSNACVSFPDLFCSIDSETGGCSLASDPYP